MRLSSVSSVVVGLMFAGVAVAADTSADADYRLPKCSQPVASVAIGTIGCSSKNCKPMGGLSGLAALASAMGAPKLMNFSDAAGRMPEQIAQSLKGTGCFELKPAADGADYVVSGDISKIMITSKTVFFKKTENTEATLDVKIAKQSEVAATKSVVSTSETSALSVSAGFITLSSEPGNKEPPSNGELVATDLLARTTAYIANAIVGLRPKGTEAVAAVASQ